MSWFYPKAVKQAVKQAEDKPGAEVIHRVAVRRLGSEAWAGKTRIEDGTIEEVLRQPIAEEDVIEFDGIRRRRKPAVPHQSM